jgi:hypothetical protein
VIYAPNRSVENRCALDLSVAPVNARDLRLRIQAKFEATWCDVANTIEVRAERRSGREPMTSQYRLHHQVGLLCSFYGESRKRSYPYLLVQQCYCLHEYRRMGTTVSGVPVPPITHRLRSILLDLTKEQFATTCLNLESLTIRITTDPAVGTAKAEEQITGGATIPLTVRGLGDLVKPVQGAWRCVFSNSLPVLESVFACVGLIALGASLRRARLMSCPPPMVKHTCKVFLQRASNGASDKWDAAGLIKLRRLERHQAGEDRR